MEQKPALTRVTIDDVVALHKRGELAAAEKFYRAFLAKNPNHFDAMHMLGVVRVQRGRPDQGEKIISKALELKPDNVAALNNRGNALYALGRYDEAMACLERALAMNPEYPEALYSRGLTYLMSGRYAEGWMDFEHRWRTRRYLAECRGNVDVGSFTLWPAREKIRGKRVLVVAEQGIGDEIMFASMLPDLMRDAGSVTLECDPRLISLFKRSFPDMEFIARAQVPQFDAAQFDCLIPQGSLGLMYRPSLQSFPRRAYLTPDPALVAKWSGRLSELGPGLKVGIAWRGGTNYTRKESRSIPIENLKPIVDVPGARFVNLQYGDVAAEVGKANQGFANPIAVFDRHELNDFDELAALVTALDLVVSVQMTICQLSGALAKRCWVMVAYTPEWRYGTDMFPMPWYNTVIRYRQRVRGEWPETIATVAGDVRQMVGQARGG